MLTTHPKSLFSSSPTNISIMKTVFTILGSAIVTMSPTFSLCAFAIYNGRNEVFDALCFLTFGATCYCLARLQSYAKK